MFILLRGSSYHFNKRLAERFLRFSLRTKNKQRALLMALIIAEKVDVWMMYFDYDVVKNKAMAEARKLHAEWLGQHFNGVDLEDQKGASRLPESPYDRELKSDEASLNELKNALLKGSVTPDEIEYVLADLLFLEMKKASRRQWSDTRSLLTQLSSVGQSPSFGISASYVTFVEYLNDYLSHLRSEKARSDEWLNKSERAIREADELMDHPLLTEVNYQLADQFRDRLKMLPKNRSKGAYKSKSYAQLVEMDIPNSERLRGQSINNRIEAVSRYCQWLIRREQMQSNPFEGLKVSTEDSVSYGYFTEADIGLILQTFIFDPDCDYFKRHGRASRWWLILIALFSGARIGEILQLTVNDVKRSDDDIYYFDITDEQEGKKIKTENARRQVPIHSQLLALGFIEYWEGIKSTNPCSRLLPEAPIGKGKISGPCSNWFREKFRDKYFPAMKDRNLVFHSFRKSFIHYALDNLRSDGDVPAMQLVVGHETGFKETMGTTAIYKRDYPLSRKQECVEAFRLDEIQNVFEFLRDEASWRKLPLQ